MRIKRHTGLLWGGLLLALLAAYSNHFQNSFHFDDVHAVVNNPAIRTLANIPQFFSDAKTFSNDPANQSYRPLVTTSLAIDYSLAGGLTPLWFHISTFLWFVAQLVLMYALYMHVLERTSPSPLNRCLAWFAVALYGLHPVSAETVNYIIQRGDLYVALGIVAGLVIYAWRPEWRRYGIYLIPPLAGMFAKPTGVAFALFLLLYILLIDRKSSPAGRPAEIRQAPKRKSGQRQQPVVVAPAHEGKQVPQSIASRLLRSMPAFILGAVFSCLEKVMTPSTFVSTTMKSFDYWITQPYVALRYFRSFFLPLYLNLDTDLHAFHSIANAAVLSGFAFCALLIAVAVLASRHTEWRPAAFGLWWFLIGLVPTSLFPLDEVENDHRMFLPFIGLSLAVVWTAVLLARRMGESRSRALATIGLLLLGAFAWGTHSRNEVWRTEETLWRDDIQKSPLNARGHYGLAVALATDPGKFEEAMSEYRAALRIKPDYVGARTNLGVILAHLPGRLPDAITEYEAGLRLTANSPELHNNLGAALLNVPGRLSEAIWHDEAALRIKPDFTEARFNLAEAHRKLGLSLSDAAESLPEAIGHYKTALRLNPNSAELHTDIANVWLRIPDHLADAISEYQTAVEIIPNSAEAHTNLGNALSRVAGRAPDAISQYETALRIKPELMEAHYNLGLLLYHMPGRTAEAMAQFEAALRIKPDPRLRQMIDQLTSRSRQPGNRTD